MSERISELRATLVNKPSFGGLWVERDKSNVPNTSNVNSSGGEIRANGYVTAVGVNGDYSVYNGPGQNSNVLLDVFGYFKGQ